MSVFARILSMVTCQACLEEQDPAPNILQGLEKEFEPAGQRGEGGKSRRDASTTFKLDESVFEDQRAFGFDFDLGGREDAFDFSVSSIGQQDSQLDISGVNRQELEALQKPGPSRFGRPGAN